MRKVLWGALGMILLLLLGGGLTLMVLVHHGVSARDQPTGMESVMARWLRHLAAPSRLKAATNPVPDAADTLARARRHFADHCALCHGNDGRGRTSIGRNFYPKVPDMTLAETQRLSDGELFSIIKNGVRLTGMPAWGQDSPEDDRETWGLVRFIRHLSKLTPQELEEMKTFNPKSRKELEEEREEERFLNGDEPPKFNSHAHQH